MSFDVMQVFHEMGLFALLITGSLFAMGIASLAVFLERLWAIHRSRQTSDRFAQEARRLLDEDAHERFLKHAEDFLQGHLARVLGAGMRVYLASVRKGESRVSPVELARRELLRQHEAANADLRRGMNVLASVGSVAPFVGLLGTVVGIIEAFAGISEKGSGGLDAVSGGISEALVVTAIGLVVAIPAVLLFNFLSSRIDSVLLALEQSRGEFVDHLESGHGVPRAVRDETDSPAVIAREIVREAADAA